MHTSPTASQGFGCKTHSLRMRFAGRALVLFVLCAIPTYCQNRTLRTSIVESPFIFEGRVASAGTSTMPNVLQKAPNLFIVEVLKPLTAPAQEFLGQKVT